MRRVLVHRSRAAGHIIFHCVQLLSPQTAAMQRRCAVLFSIGASSVGHAATAARLCGVQCSCRPCLFRRVRWGMRPLLRSMRCAVFLLVLSIGLSSVENAATAASLCGVQCSCRSCLFRRVRWGMRPLLRSMRCAVFLLFLSIGVSSVRIAATAATHACISDRPCAPADCEPEADVLDRHAKSRSETSKFRSPPVCPGGL